MFWLLIGVASGLALSRTKFGKDLIKSSQDMWAKHNEEATKVFRKAVDTAKDQWKKLRGHDYLNELKK